MQEQQMGEIISDPGIAVHRGTSGSPVFDDTGAVIGVTMMSVPMPKRMEWSHP